MSFLPTGYEQPASSATGGRYLSPSKIEDGASIKLRILSDAITGWEYWTAENKPVRSKEQFKQLPADIRMQDGKPDRIKHFWAFIVYNYEIGEVQICQVTQKTIQDGILALLEDWGEPGRYDIRIKREGERLETKYTVVPIPPSEFTNTEAINEAMTINLNALYDGSDPFDGSVSPANTESNTTPAFDVETAFQGYLNAYEAKPDDAKKDFAKRCLQKAVASDNTELAAKIEAHIESHIESEVPF